MVKVIWAPSAIEDVNAIADYISRDSPDHASLFVARLINSVDQLENFPLSGRIIPEIGNELCREIIYGSYRIMYKIVDEGIWITGIVHHAMKWEP
ncbi:MAG: type II toxin-antitoxin system RelE/ParE family toxin [Deltaproteobacteria bacterium]|nr:type II toxin-antitoxin system RelE/ParE family toxin [Deltaproteobacteria bacterium]